MISRKQSSALEYWHAASRAWRLAATLLLLICPVTSSAQPSPQVQRLALGFRQNENWAPVSASMQLINYSAAGEASISNPCVCANPASGGPGLHQNLLLIATFEHRTSGRRQTVYVPFGYGGNVPYQILQAGTDYGVESETGIPVENLWQVYDDLIAFQGELSSLINQGEVCYNLFGDNFFGRFSNNLASCVGLQSFQTPTFNCRDVASFMWARFVTCEREDPPPPPPPPPPANNCRDNTLAPRYVMFYSSSCGPSELYWVLSPEALTLHPQNYQTNFYYNTVPQDYAGARWRLAFYTEIAPAIPNQVILEGAVGEDGTLIGLPSSYTLAGCPGGSGGPGGYYALLFNHAIEVSCDGVNWPEYRWGSF